MSNKIETLAKIQEVGIVAVVRATSIEQAEKIMLGDRRKKLDEVNFALSRTKK